MSLFESGTYRQDYRSDTLVSTRGGILITATGNSGLIEVFSSINGNHSLVGSYDVSCNPSLHETLTIGAGQEFSYQITGIAFGDCVSISVTEINAVTGLSGPIEIDTASLAPIVNAISDQTTDLQIALQAQTASITSSLQSILDELSAGITVNAVQSGTWTVTINGQPIQVENTNYQDLVDLLETSDLTVTIGDQDQVLDVNITNAELTVDLAPITDLMMNTVRVDYEETSLCVLDANGDKIPNVGIFKESKYNYLGAVVSRDAVFSELTPAGFVAYTLQAGETIGECVVETEAQEPYTLIAECFEEDANAGTFKKVFKYVDTSTFPATIIGYTEDDLITVADLTGWTKTDDCDCKSC